MSSFENAVVSLPGRDRIAKTPFGAGIVIHATAAETGGAFGLWETFTPPGGYGQVDLLDGVVIVGGGAVHAEIRQGAATLSF
ncbi:hypothetical protein GGE45_005961 [Rhizobium aethiopicum]|uniref:Uncharacterized protein n=1 Tax=Rhizobium aethiopicum TaxID=1138170 RepID=A0A7W6QE68_9HYPH|nr:hypothetical protein [Rhizobium aethiopicum]MBB4583587.1 hypothetical protein [Rhizobium aethiopicum]